MKQVDSKGLHPIRVAARRSGLSTFVIRAWQRRYRAVIPVRTATNRRLYSDADIERLILLRRATEAGESIGQIAGLSDDELRSLISSVPGDAPPEVATRALEKDATHHISLSLDALRHFDVTRFRERIIDASIALSRQALLEEFLAPLLVEIGEMWNAGRLSVAQEHLASAVVRSLLGSMLVTGKGDHPAPVVVATTPLGQGHEFGALMASITATSKGWRAIYLGPNLPAEDIAQAVERNQARVLALSIVYPPDDPRLAVDLEKIGRFLRGRTAIMAGGRAASRYAETLKRIGARRIADLKELRTALDEVRDQGTPDSQASVGSPPG